jgi:prepilin peptidase CpaA
MRARAAGSRRMSEHRLLSLLPMLALLVWAAADDLRTRKIRNWLTLSLAWGGIVNSIVSSSGITPAQAGLGLLIGFALPFVLFAMGALGGGDVKLFAGVGAWLGAVGIVQVFIIAAIVGLVIVLAQSIAQRRVSTLFRNSTVLLLNLWHVGADGGLAAAAETGKACRSVERPLPYAVPILAATLLVAAFQ